MEKEIFTNPQVINYYNSGFINYKIDIEDGGIGEALAKQYGIAGFPTYLYFDKNGKTDPIMGHYLQHKKVPALPRESLNQQMVQFRKKFITYKDYSEALFDDLFSKEELGNALHLQARELRHMYAENKNGTLVFTPLPMESQLAPANNTLIGDFDRDGKLDAIVTGGFFPNEAHQGRQDASRGIFLKGSGNGTFRSVPNYRSGLYLSGDVRHSIFLEKSGLMISFKTSGTSPNVRTRLK